MFTVNQVPFKNDVHALIDAFPDDPEKGDNFVEDVVELSKSYGIVISGADFGAAIFKLIQSRNASRAHKLVDALDDQSLTLVGFTLRTTAKFIFKYGMLALFILFLMWAYNNWL